MNDLIISRQFANAFPTITEGLKRAQRIFNSINSFQDIEDTFLKGAGLSDHTYRSYLQAVKEFYAYTNGLNPLQCKPSHIEAFYDHLIKRVDRNTAYLRIRGLKRFFAGIRNVIPFYTSPFEIMSKKLNKKLNRTKRGNRTKRVLSKRILRDVLNNTTGSMHSIIFMLATSGLRASELLQLRWKDIKYYDGVYTAYFIGKGGKEAEQELFEPAIEDCKRTFRDIMGRTPTASDYLYYTEDGTRPLQYPALWARFKKTGKALKQAGIIHQDIQFTPHLLRRTYATLLYRSGMKIKAIQTKTRHASADTLLRHYIYDTEPAKKYLDTVFA